MNKVYLIGRVTKDLEPQQFGNEERTYVKFTLAVDDYKSNTKEYTTNFINIVAFDRNAEILSQYITKGHKLSVEGKVRTGSYLDRNNIKKYAVDVILEDFDFIDNKPTNGWNNTFHPFSISFIFLKKYKKNGSAKRTRTSNLSVNSRVLHH